RLEGQGPPVAQPTAPLRFAATELRRLGEGFHGLEWSGGAVFRWTEPSACLRLRLPPGDYRLCLDMKHLSSLWSGQLQVVLDESPIPCRDRQLQAGVLSQVLLRSDFQPTSEHFLRLEFSPADTSSWPTGEARRLGAPLFEIGFERPD